MPHSTWGGGTETRLDLQRFASVTNPYNDELEEDLEVSSKIDQISTNFRFLITPGKYTATYGYVEDRCGSYQTIGIEPQSPLSSKLNEFVAAGSEGYDSLIIVSFSANYSDYQYSKMNINVRDYSGVLVDYNDVYIVELDITGDSENINATAITNIDISGIFRAAYEMNNSGVSCQLEVYGNFQ